MRCRYGNQRRPLRITFVFFGWGVRLCPVSTRNTYLDQPRIGAPSGQIILLTHNLFFLESPDEGDRYFTVSRERCLPAIELFQKHGVWALFGDHWHRSHYMEDNGMLMAETGTVGFPWEMIQPVLHCRSSRWRPEYEYHELVNGPPLVRDEEDID